MPCSVILLLRTPHFFTTPELEAAGEKGWNISFDGKTDPMYFVVQMGAVTMIKAGTNVIHVIQANSPYLEDVEAVAKRLPQEEQKKAWREHNAWASLDHLNEQTSKSKDRAKRAESYSVLARFALHLGNENCCGIYLPKEQILMPNNGTAEEGLRLLIRKELFG